MFGKIRIQSSQIGVLQNIAQKINGLELKRLPIVEQSLVLYYYLDPGEIFRTTDPDSSLPIFHNDYEYILIKSKARIRFIDPMLYKMTVMAIKTKSK